MTITPALATRAQQWQALADRALTGFQAVEGGQPPSAFALAFAGQTVAWTAGWDDPQVSAYLSRIYVLQNPDGGYGLNRPYDAHGNGTVNPATTTYIVTITDHVGKFFLNGVKAGKVAASRVQKFVDLIATAPRIDTAAGRAVAFSMNASDAQPGLCTHNVNAGAAAWLMLAADAGFSIPWYLVQGIIKREMSAYNAGTRFWPYRDNTAPTPQDADHNSYSAESFYLLAPAVGYSAAYTAMTTAPDGDPTTPIVYMRLAGLPAIPAAMNGEVTVWTTLGDQWLGQVDAFITANTNQPIRLAQAAYYCTKAARAAAGIWS